MVTVVQWVMDGTAPFDALIGVLDHYWQAEAQDYAANPTETHVFRHLVAIANWMNTDANRTPESFINEWEKSDEGSSAKAGGRPETKI